MKTHKKQNLVKSPENLAWVLEFLYATAVLCVFLFPAKVAIQKFVIF